MARSPLRTGPVPDASAPSSWPVAHEGREGREGGREDLRQVLDLLEDGLYLMAADGRLDMENAAGQRLRSEPAPISSVQGEGGDPYFFEDQPGESVATLDQVLARVAGQAFTARRAVTASVVRAGP